MIKKDIAVFLAIILFVSIIIYGYQKDKRKRLFITLDRNCEILKAHDSIQFKFNPFAKQIKDIIIVNDLHLKHRSINWAVSYSGIEDWIPYIKKYPYYPFLFCIKSDSKKRVLKYLQKIKFPIPILVQPLKKSGIILIAYRVDKNNEVITVTNPTLSNFKPFLEKNKKKYMEKKGI